MSEAEEDPKICGKTGKKGMTKNAATQLKRRALEIHHFYKCEFCSRYHVSSLDDNREFIKGRRNQKKGSRKKRR